VQRVNEKEEIRIIIIKMESEGLSFDSFFDHLNEASKQGKIRLGGLLK
jgi:hypothetical protein